MALSTSITSAADAAKSAAQTASTNLSALTGPLSTVPAGLTTNTWLGKANDNLKVADAYTGIDGKSVITTVENLLDLDKVNLSLSDLVRGGKWIAGNMPALSSLVRGGVAAFDQKGLTARLLGATGLAGQLSSFVSRFSGGATDGLLGAFNDNKQLFASINGVTQRVLSTNLSDITQVGGLINSLTNNTSLFNVNDLDGQVGLYAGLIRDCTSYGIPNSFESLTAKLVNTNLLSQVANRVLPDVINASDVGSLLSIGQRLGDKGALSLNPSLISEFSFKYVLPPLATNADGSVAFDKIMAAYRAVDSSWDTATRVDSLGNTISMLNLNSLRNTSDDFQTILEQGCKKSTDPNEQMYQLASVFDYTTVEDSLKTSFPMTLFKPNLVQNSAITDSALVRSNPGLGAMGGMFVDSRLDLNQTLSDLTQAA